MAKKKASKEDVRVTYLIPLDVKEGIETAAGEQDSSASRVIRQILKDWLKHRNPDLESEINHG